MSLRSRLAYSFLAGLSVAGWSHPNDAAPSTRPADPAPAANAAQATAEPATLEAVLVPPLADVAGFLAASPLLRPFRGAPVVEPGPTEPAADAAETAAAVVEASLSSSSAVPMTPAGAPASAPAVASPAPSADSGPVGPRALLGSLVLGRAPLTLATFVEPPELAPPAHQEVDWFQTGPYVGALLGAATLGVSDGDFEDDLDQLGNTTAAELDEVDFAWRAYGGWRFDAPFSVELGYSHLGRADSTVAANVPNVQAFLDDVVATQPFLGRGIELEGRWWVIDTDRFDLGLGGGLWYWTAEIEAMAATGERASATEHGLYPLLGIDALYRVLDRLDARAGLEHYWIEDEGAIVLWVGLQGRIF
jgi:hypothetical protein